MSSLSDYRPLAPSQVKWYYSSAPYKRHGVADIPAKRGEWFRFCPSDSRKLERCDLYSAIHDYVRHESSHNEQLPSYGCENVIIMPYEGICVAHSPPPRALHTHPPSTPDPSRPPPPVPTPHTFFSSYLLLLLASSASIATVSSPSGGKKSPRPTTKSNRRSPPSSKLPRTPKPSIPTPRTTIRYTRHFLNPLRPVERVAVHPRDEAVRLLVTPPPSPLIPRVPRPSPIPPLGPPRLGPPRSTDLDAPSSGPALTKRISCCVARSRRTWRRRPCGCGGGRGSSKRRITRTNGCPCQKASRTRSRRRTGRSWWMNRGRRRRGVERGRGL